MTNIVTRAPTLDVLNDLLPGMEARLDRAGAAQTVPIDTVREWQESGLLRMRVPVEFGGADVDVTTAFSAIETLSHLDGATGWTFMAGSSLLGLAATYLPEDNAASLLSDPVTSIAGQIAPRGTAEPAGEGYRIKGGFGFSSGSPHSTHLLGGFREICDGKPVRTEHGLPNVVAAVVPREQVELLGNWDVFGLQGTASVDYRIPEQEIPRGFTWPLFGSAALRGGPLNRMGVYGVTAIDHSAFSIGTASRALDEVVAVATGKRRLGRSTLIDDPIFQYEFAKARAALWAARAFALESLRELEHAAAHDTITQQQRARVRLAATHAASTAVEVTGVAYRFSGSTGLRNGSAIQQCLRDITASEAHVFTDHNTWRDSAGVLLGIAPDHQPI